MKTSDYKVIKYTLTGMDCPGCGNTIETFCKKIPGIENAEVHFPSSTLFVTFSSLIKGKEKVEKGIRSLGYKLTENSDLKNNFDTNLRNKLALEFRKNHKIPSNLKTNKNSNNVASAKVKESEETLYEAEHNHSHEHEKINWKSILILSIGFLISFIMESYSKNIGIVAFSAVTIIGLFPILKKAFILMRVGYVFSVETLMSISAIGAIFIGAAEEAAAVIILFMIGESLESYTAKRARSGIKSLASLLPDTALLVMPDGSSKKIKVSDIQPGDLIEVKPGERLPVDGVVYNGTSFVDESLLTGESLPLNKSKGDKVVAGSISTDGNIIIKATGSGNNNTITRMIHMVEDAQGSKSRIMRSIEKFSRVYTPIILALGTLVAVIPPLFLSMPWHDWVYRGLTIFLIGCPCALIISTPSAIASGITAATKLGILIKNASAIEAIGKVTKIAFDKTGTITHGKLQISNIISFGANEDEILRIAAAVESKSNHPLAKAIFNYASHKNINIPLVTQAKALPGKGVSASINDKEALVCSKQYALELNLLNEEQMQIIDKAQFEGKTGAVVAYNKVTIGFIALADELKQDAASSIAKLKSMGIQSIILTGDNKIAAHAIAGKLGAEIKSELLPEQKLEYIQTISKREKVAMVGDGINDAPAIAAAEIGIAMGGGTDVAVDTAQVVISRNSVAAVVDTVILSRKTMLNIKQNITLAIGLKAIFLLLTIVGETQLWMAILADTGATVIVTLNALRLLRFKK